MSGPEPQLNRITNVEDNNKSSIVKVQPGLLLIANKKMRIYSSASIAENLAVVGIPFVLVCQSKSMCPMKRSVSRKRCAGQVVMPC